MWNSTKAFYDSKEWRVFRENLIIDRTSSYGLSCSKCNKNILKEKIILHHKQELTKENVNDYNISLNPDNIEILCLDCHNKEHSRFGYKKSKGIYLCGELLDRQFPCGGYNLDFTWHSGITVADSITKECGYDKN